MPLEHLSLGDFRAALQPVKVKHDVRVEAHLNQIAGAHVGAVGNDVGVVHAARVTVDEKLLRRHALQAQLALHLGARDLDVKHRRLDVDAKLIALHPHFHFFLKHLHVGVLRQQVDLSLRQVGEGVYLGFRVAFVIRLNYALLFNQCVVYGVAQHAVAV